MTIVHCTLKAIFFRAYIMQLLCAPNENDFDHRTDFCEWLQILQYFCNLQLNRCSVLLMQMFLFLQSNECGSPNVIPLEELNAPLSSVHCIHHDVV